MFGNHLRSWYARFQAWWIRSPTAIAALKQPNDICESIVNTGLSLSLFVGDMAHAKRLAGNDSKVMLDRLLGPGGNFSNDPAATGVDSFGYTMSDFVDFLLTARMSTLTGEVDLYNYVTPQGSSLHDGIEWLAPYCAKNATNWPRGGNNGRASIPVMQAISYGDS